MFFTCTMCRGNDGTAARPVKCPPRSSSAVACAASAEMSSAGLGCAAAGPETSSMPPSRRMNDERFFAHFQLQQLHAVVADVDADGLNLWPVQSEHL